MGRRPFSMVSRLCAGSKRTGNRIVYEAEDSAACQILRFSYSCGGGHSFSLQSSAHALADSIFCRPSWLQAFLLQALACLQYRFGWEQATCCWNSPWRISDSSSWRPNAVLYLYFKIQIFLYPSRRTEFDCGQRKGWHAASKNRTPCDGLRLGPLGNLKPAIFNGHN